MVHNLWTQLKTTDLNKYNIASQHLLHDLNLLETWALDTF